MFLVDLEAFFASIEAQQNEVIWSFYSERTSERKRSGGNFQNGPGEYRPASFASEATRALFGPSPNAQSPNTKSSLYSGLSVRRDAPVVDRVVMLGRSVASGTSPSLILDLARLDQTIERSTDL